MGIEDESIIREYYDLRQKLDIYTKDMRNVITHPNYCLQFMQPGRLVRIKYKEHDFGWGAVVNFTMRKPMKGQAAKDIPPQQSYVVDVLLNVASDSSHASHSVDDLPAGIRPPSSNEKGKMEVVPILLSCIDSIGHIRIFLPNELRSYESKNTVRKSLNEVKRRFPDGIAILDPIENMGITDESFKKLLRVRVNLSSPKDSELKMSRKLKYSNQGLYLILYITLPNCLNSIINMHQKLRLQTGLRI